MGKRVNGRRKGANHERAIAIDLRGWLSPEATGELWTVLRAQTDRQAGQDPEHAGEFVIKCVGGRYRFPWAFELKAEQAWHESQLWATPPNGPIASTGKRRGYWQQAVEQASSVGLTPVLVVKRNRGPVLAIMERKTWQRLATYSLPRHRFILPLDGEQWDLVAVPWSAVLATHPSNVIEEL